MKALALAAVLALAACASAQDVKRLAVITYPFPTTPSTVLAKQDGPQYFLMGPGQIIHVINRYQAAEFEVFADGPVTIHEGDCDKANTTSFDFVCNASSEISLIDPRDPRDNSSGSNSVRIIWHGVTGGN